MKQFLVCLRLCLLGIFFLFFSHFSSAQRVQLQVQLGANFSKATIEDNGQLMRETSTFYDTLGSAQYGLAARFHVIKHFYLRLDGSFRAYRTFYQTKDSPGNGPYAILGNLFSEKFNLSFLPEYQIQLSRSERVRCPLYLFAGPVLAFESGKNFSDSYIIDNGSETILGQIKPDAQGGWSAGVGINPQFGRFGFLLEGRYTRFGYANEDLPVGKIAYSHFTTSIGITYNVVK